MSALDALRGFVLGMLATAAFLVVVVTVKVGREIRELGPSERGSAIVMFLFMILNLLIVSVPLMLVGGAAGVVIAYVVGLVGR